VVDQPNGRGERPLHLACREGHLAAVRALLEAGAEPLLCNGRKWRPRPRPAHPLMLPRAARPTSVSAVEEERRSHRPAHYTGGESAVEVARRWREAEAEAVLQRWVEWGALTACRQRLGWASLTHDRLGAGAVAAGAGLPFASGVGPPSNR
jgi:hypothetical protein